MILDQIFIWNQKNVKKNDSEKVLNVITEKPVRSIVKSISWRLIGTIDTFIISWLITGKVSLALTIGGIELVTKMVLYFFHERIWNVIKWGKK